MIGRIYQKYDYLIDPHTAVAFDALEQYRSETGDQTPCIVVSTASPFKFCDSVLQRPGRGGEAERAGAAGRAERKDRDARPQAAGIPPGQGDPLHTDRGKGPHGGRGAGDAGVSDGPVRHWRYPPVPQLRQAHGCLRRRMDGICGEAAGGTVCAGARRTPWCSAGICPGA